jgi:hypothetical protein
MARSSSSDNFPFPGGHAPVRPSIEGDVQKFLLGSLKLFEVWNGPTARGIRTMIGSTELIIE